MSAAHGPTESPGHGGGGNSMGGLGECIFGYVGPIKGAMNNVGEICASIMGLGLLGGGGHSKGGHH